MNRIIQLNRQQSVLDWVAQIVILRDEIDKYNSSDDIQFIISDDIDTSYLKPLHIVTLACLLDYAITHHHKVVLFAMQDVETFFKDNLHLQQYFGDTPYIEATTPSIFNLWKVENSQVFGYSHSLSDYLKRAYFKGKDLSAFTNALNELYANVSDHAEANGTAYSYIHLDEKSGKIRIAFCDFGIGIPSCLKKAGIHPESEKGYIQLATRLGISAKSSSHNAGKGLDDVISSLTGDYDRLKILSENEYCIVGEKRTSDGTSDRIEKTIPLAFCFKGTLIYFEYDIDEFEDEEIIGEIDLFSDYNW